MMTCGCRPTRASCFDGDDPVGMFFSVHRSWLAVAVSSTFLVCNGDDRNELQSGHDSCFVGSSCGDVVQPIIAGKSGGVIYKYNILKGCKYEKLSTI